MYQQASIGLLRAMARGRAPRGCLRYSTRARLIVALFWFAAIGFVVLEALYARSARERASPVWAAVVMAFLALPMLLEVFRVTIRHDDDGIHVSSPWSRRRTLLWSEIRSARWRPLMKWLDLSDGSQVVHISPILVGLEEFGATCLAKLSEEALATHWEVSSVLRLMERGDAVELFASNEGPGRVLLQPRP